MTRVLEYIHHIQTSLFTIRVWASVEGITWTETERQRQLGQIERAIATNYTKEWIADQISQLSFCNAVEVIDGNSSGVLIYPDWP